MASLAVLPPLGLFASGFALLTAAFARAPLVAALLACLLALLAVAVSRSLPPPVPTGPSARVGWAGLVLSLVGGWAMPSGIAAWLHGIAAAAPVSSAEAIRGSASVPCRPWPRHVMAADRWAALEPDDVALQAMWADTAEVHALFLGGGGQPLLASTAVRDGHYPALSCRFLAAAAPERAIRDLWGHAADGAADTRPWLDHGHWRLTHPLAARHGPAGGGGEPVFRPVPGELMQLPSGPVFGLPAEPVHLRSHIDGERVVATEARLGYAHKGTLLLMRGKSPRAAARFAARLSADSTVAHAAAYARAAEAALATAAPPRAAMLRGVMAETERVSTHLGDLASACRDRPRLASPARVAPGNHAARRADRLGASHDDGLRRPRRAGRRHRRRR